MFLSVFLKCFSLHHNCVKMQPFFQFCDCLSKLVSLLQLTGSDAATATLKLSCTACLVINLHKTLKELYLLISRAKSIYSGCCLLVYSSFPFLFFNFFKQSFHFCIMVQNQKHHANSLDSSAEQIFFLYNTKGITVQMSKLVFQL